MNRETLIPEYLMDFSCIGAACEDTCCAGWRVNVDKATFQKYRNIKIPGIKEELKKNVKRDRSNSSFENYGKIKLDEKNACTLLTEDGWCKIHLELGEEFLCNTCMVYPRILNKVDHRVEKSLTPSCPEAARLVLLNKDGIGFVVDEENDKTKGLLVKEIQSAKRPYFWDLRMFTIQVLQNRQQSIEERLVILGLFYQNLHSLSEKELGNQIEVLINKYSSILDDHEKVQLLMSLPKNISFQMDMAKELLKVRLDRGILSQRYLDCLKEMLNALHLSGMTDIKYSIDLYNDFYSEYYKPFINNHEYILENYAVNYVFKNLFPYDQSNLFESYVMLVVNISLIKLHLIGMAGKHKGLSLELVVKLVQSYVKTMEHNPVYLQNILRMLRESGYLTMAHMVVLLKS